MSDRLYSEAEIPDGYNQPKDDDDDNNYQSAFRYLTEWYLTDTRNPDKPLALPDKAKFAPTHVIRGILVASSTDHHMMPPIHVQLQNLKHWCVDRSKAKRGIWVESSSSGDWYWLKQPHSSFQEHLHLPIRAKMGLLSNILDVFMEQRNAEVNYYAPDHFKKSPQQVYDRLSCQDDDELLYSRHNTNPRALPLYKMPWDMDLLKSSVPFLKIHLNNFGKGFDKSVFWKELNKLKAPKDVKWTPDKYKTSAELAEQRAQQMPWGEPCANAKPIRPNWMMEAVAGHNELPLPPVAKSAKRSAGSSNDKEVPKTKAALRTKETRKQALDDNSDDDNDSVPKGKKQKPLSRKRTLEDSSDDNIVPKKKAAVPSKQRRSLRDSDQGGTNGEKENKAKTPLEDAKYSAKRMVEALKQFKDFLMPTPLPDESGEWENVNTKFAISEERTALELVVKMKSSKEWSDECKLLVIAAFLNSCLQKNKLVKTLFDIKKLKKRLNLKKAEEARKLLGVCFFEQWRDDAVNTLEQLAPNQLAPKSALPETCAYKLLLAHLQFIQNCSVVKNKAILDTLNEKYGLSWNNPNDYMNKVILFGHKNAPPNFVSVCVRTRRHLENMIRAGDTKNPTSATVTVASVEGIVAMGDATSQHQKHLTDVMNAGDTKNPTVATMSVASVEGIIGKGGTSSQHDEEAEKKRKFEQQRREKMKEKLEKLKKAATLPSNMAALQPGPQATSLPSNAAAFQPGLQAVSFPSNMAAFQPGPQAATQPSNMAALQPGRQAATQPSTSAMVASSGPSDVASSPAYEWRTGEDNPHGIDPMWTDAKPLFVLRALMCNYQQTDSVQSGVRQEPVQEETSSGGNPVAHVPVAARAQDMHTGSRSHDYDRGSGRSESRGPDFGRRSEHMGNPVAHVPVAARAQDMHSDSRSRDYDRGSGRSESRSRDFGKRSEPSGSRSQGYDRESDSPSGQSERMPQDYRPRNDSQVDRPDRKPAFRGMHNNRGRGRGTEMTLPAWMTRQDPCPNTSHSNNGHMNGPMGFNKGNAH